MYQLLVTQTFAEPGNKNFAMTTTVVGFETLQEAEAAYKSIDAHRCISAVYTHAIRLY
jgi:hypothetical protein